MDNVLRERVFEIGGLLTIALGILFVAFLLNAGAGPVYFTYYVTPAWLFAFGGFFLWVGRAARNERRRSLMRLESEGLGVGSDSAVR